MSERKFAVCRTLDGAAAQRVVLERVGYTVASQPVHYDTIVWDATDARGANDIRDDLADRGREDLSRRVAPRV
jgi:hypothetical protein